MNADRQIRFARILAVLFCAAGAVAIAVGWDAAARHSSVGSQLPYLLSGGAAGIGLLTFGVGLLIVAQMRAERRRIIGVLDVMGATVAQRARESLARVAEEHGAGQEEGFGLPVRGARILALACAMIGFIMIAVGWNGMANANSVDQQLPFLLSGGFGGMALILFSVGLLVVAQIRTERRRLMDLLEVMAVALRTAAGDVDASDEQPTKAGSPKNRSVELATDDSPEQRAAV